MHLPPLSLLPSFAGGVKGSVAIPPSEGLPMSENAKRCRLTAVAMLLVVTLAVLVYVILTVIA